MIISYSRNFIYFRTRKTGSSTIKEVLSRFLGPEDLSLGKFTQAHATHVHASKVMGMVPEDFWKRAFKFTSERHPYEKAVSLAYYNFNKREKNGRGVEGGFEPFLDRTVRQGGYRGFEFYAIDGKVVVDDFIRIESFCSDLKRIGARVGIATPEKLPRKRMSSRDKPAREILSDEHKRIVFETCREEFELLGYEP